MIWQTTANSNSGARAKRARELARKAVRRMVPAAPWPVRPVILMYHHVADESFDPWGLAVPPARFESQMHWLAANRTVLPLSEFARRHDAGSLPSDAAAITFDDGYGSVAENAVPILDRLALAATIFIPAGLIESRREFWWDELERLIIGMAASTLVTGGEEMQIGPPEPGDELWSPGAPPSTRRQEAFHLIWSRIRTKPQPEIERTLSELRRQPGVPLAPRPSRRPMTPEEVRSVASERVKIGSHALTHPSLPALSADRRTIEVRDSVAACESMSGERPSAFAYPFGEYDQETEELVRSSGFLCACTTERDPVTRDARSSALPRLGVRDWPAELLARVLLEL